MPAIATNSNRINSQGAPPSSNLGKTSLTITNVLPANTSLNLAVAGSFFYLISATGELQIKPSNGIPVPYSSGMGLEVDLHNSFSSLELKNTTANAIVFVLFVGFDKMIDKRLVIADVKIPQVAYPTYPVPNAAAFINIPDLAGFEFLDANGAKWIAVSRTAILVFNLDDTKTQLVQAAGSIGIPAVGPPVIYRAVGAAYPRTTIRLDFTGGYKIYDPDAANLNIIVTEIYSAVANPN